LRVHREGYDPRSPLCGSCLPGWYPEVTGECLQCPERAAAKYGKVCGTVTRMPPPPTATVCNQVALGALGR
jgi:hypothetical protein